jgi:hypothetical protein
VSNLETARNCLRLIRDIAERGAASWDPADVGYALQELRQVIVESAGFEDRLFEPVPANEIPDLGPLHEELEWVNDFSHDMCARKLCN